MRPGAGTGKAYSVEYDNAYLSDYAEDMPEKTRQIKMQAKDPLVQELARTFGENVRILREGGNLTKTKLAGMVGHSRSHVTDIEDGLIDADFSKLAEFAQAFECPVEALITPGGGLRVLSDRHARL